MRTSIVLASLLVFASCKEKPSEAKKNTPVATQQTAKQDAPPKAPPSQKAQKGNDWIPAEFNEGRKKFKDPGVYLDGKPIGMLHFAELPVPLAPVWKEKRKNVAFLPKDKGTKVQNIQTAPLSLR